MVKDRPIAAQRHTRHSCLLIIGQSRQSGNPTIVLTTVCWYP